MAELEHASANKVPLSRLLRRKETDALLDAFQALLPGADLALVGPDGRFFSGAGEWLPSDLAQHLAQSEPGSILQTAAFWLELLVIEAQLVGAVVGRGPISEGVWRCLHASLIMTLGQAVEKREVARETLERYREINLLYHVGETIGACLNPEEIPDLVLTEANRVVQSAVGMVLLPGSNGEAELEVKAILDPAGQAEALSRAARGLIKQVQAGGRPDILTLPALEEGGLGSILGVPLKSRERVLGLVLLGRLAAQAVFTAGEEKLVMALAGQAAVAIEKAWLHLQEIERQRLEEELAVGRQIQLSLLPKVTPTLPGWEFAAIYRAARQVGGDLYDFFELPDSNSRLGMVIADVTGKGVPAALFMAFSRTVIRSEAMSGRNPAAVLERANRLIGQDNRSKLFLSAFYAVLDTGSGRLIFANGGHNRPLWFQAATGAVAELKAAGIILGAFEGIKLEERQLDLAPGDFLVCYTDGVTEARDEDDQLFGEARLRQAVAAAARTGAEEVLQAVLTRLEAFSGERPQADDFTLFVVKRQS